MTRSSQQVIAPAVAVVMGASGTGKSTVGELLAARLGWPFAEGDDLHPYANVHKMRTGMALTDDDRWPWLHAVAAWIGEREADGTGGVVTCSALKRSYRDLLRAGRTSVRFLCLVGEYELIRNRMERRTHHYMPALLLDSQLATLEALQADEPGRTLDSTLPPDRLVLQAISYLNLA
jgi:gluconokinase